MAGRFFRVLFPDEPRAFPGRRWAKILARGAHVLCAGVFMGAYLFDVEPGVRLGWLLATVVSGLVLLLLDLHETATFLVQFRGLVFLTKVGLLATLHWFGDWKAWVLGFLVLISVVSSHASAKVRYKVLFGAGRLKGSESQG